MKENYPSQNPEAIPRGAIKRFREYLNNQDDGIPHQHLRFHQRTRKYGDYLYAQDRDKFMANLRDWLSSPTETQNQTP